jgi:hypothetical protein
LDSVLTESQSHPIDEQKKELMGALKGINMGEIEKKPELVISLECSKCHEKGAEIFYYGGNPEDIDKQIAENPELEKDIGQFEVLCFGCCEYFGFCAYCGTFNGGIESWEFGKDCVACNRDKDFEEGEEEF